MGRTMSLAASRARAEQAFVMREVGMQPWSKICSALGFKSHGAAQNAVKRYQQRNELPGAQTVAHGIVERNRVSLGIALSALAGAQKRGDFRVVAQLVDAITRANDSLARLYGLGQTSTVNVNVTHQTPSQIIEEAQARLLAVLDAEVVDQPALDAAKP